MNKNVVRGLFVCAGLASSAGTLLAQAPASAQIWECRFVVDSDGPFAQGPYATAVGITLQARVTILANTASSGTTNIGVSSVGGGVGAVSPFTSPFVMTFADALSAGLGLNQGTATRGATGEMNGAVARVSTEGDPIAGSFAAFRVGFGGGPNFMAANTYADNGVYTNPATGSPTISRVVGNRGLNFGAENTATTGLGVGTQNSDGSISGAFADVYRMVFLPRAEFSSAATRNITLTASNVTARYLYAINGSFTSSGARVPVTIPSISFQVPAPGAAALVGLGGLVALRRRR